MKLIDVLRTDEPVIDRYTFVFDEQEPNGNHTMLATDSDGRMFSQWTTGEYVPDGDNSHLGDRPQIIGEILVNHVIGRLESE